MHRLGFRYRLHRSELPGRPDLVFPSRSCIIEVRGCFWHQHPAVRCKARPPKSNRKYWLPKLERNVRRDVANVRKLRRLGWRVLIVWECQTSDEAPLARRIQKFLSTCRSGHRP